MGIIWSILNPLLMMVVMAAVFSHVFRFSIENFPLYLILGNTLFSFMSNSTSDALMSIIQAAPLIKKIRVQKMVFPLEKILFGLVNFAISLIAVAIVMLFFRIVPTPAVLFLPLLLVYVTIFCIGIGLALAALAVFFRDVIHLWSVIIVAWTYATPLFYPIDILAPWMLEVMEFNPMYHYVTYFRDIMLYGTVPSLETNLLCLAMALVTAAIGILIFKKSEKRFILYV